MTDVFTETLQSWQNFYFMAGGAAATLIGLMFVALSLGINLVSEETKAELEVFVTPSIVYFVSVLLLACVMLVPAFTPRVLAVITFTGGLFGLALTVRYATGLTRIARQHGDFSRADWLLQVILPVVNYALIVLAAVCFAGDQWSFGFGGLWLATVLLLVSAIANTWSLVIWIVNQRR